MVRVLSLATEAEEALREALRDRKPWLAGTALGCLGVIKASVEASLESTLMKAAE
jgi:hypothetical protein